MLLTIEAMIDEQGNIRLLDATRLPVGRRAFVTILDESVPTKSNGQVKPAANEMSDAWKDFFEILDELAEEEYTPEDGYSSATEAFLATRR